ncbi:ALF repeat-containing protein, partial [Streptomyces sp. TRM64462]|uniref:ALF repeat-containing protein n=1 Tax=Streptomyces sp. TRM64462 TaxID=2741726 RepID=UPI001585F1C8
RAAAAARVARDAANSAAAHALKAADAADEAAANAGKAIEYAKRSTAYAEAAVQAATTAANAVKEAQAVEQAAREAEAARIAEDTELGILEARLRAQAEIDDNTRVERERTEADKTATEIKDLLAAAQTALQGGDTATAVTTGRKAAVKLLDSTGTWTREAAEFALSGTDHDMVNWLDTDRLIAQRQDDRETVLAIAQAAKSSVATAAAAALASTDPDAPRAFLDHGVIEAAAMENRVLVFRILGENPGKAVKAKAEAALNAGTALALHRFLTAELPAAIKEDDSVEVFRLLGVGGPYMQSAAKIVLEGSARMRRNFIAHDQHNIARLDHDHATHVAAIRAAIAHAAKVAAKALEDAALASQAAAEARKAASEAADWAAKAQGYAADAKSSAAEAKANADAADKSAAAAAQSAETAKQAASVARSAARTANYSMRKALASAKQAVTYASNAQASATSAQASATQAGKDAKAAADAASAAHKIVADKRKAEAEAAARAAAEAAKQHEQNGTNPSDGEVDDDGDTKYWGLWPEDMSDPKDWADATGHWSTIAGTAGLVLGIGALFFPPLGVAAAVAGLVSWGLQGVSTILKGVGYGWDSSQFKESLGIFVVGGLFLGKGQLFKKFGVAEEIGAKVSGVVSDAATTVVGWLTW